MRTVGAGGSGERCEGRSARIPALSHSPHCRSHISQAEQSSPGGISLKDNNSPAHRNHSCSASGYLSWAAENTLKLYHWLSLTTKADFWELSRFSWPSPGPGAGKSWPWCAACSSLHTNMPSRRSHMPWITESSEQVAPGQSQINFLHLNLSRCLCLRD